jgi:hypothetical protein
MFNKAAYVYIMVHRVSLSSVISNTSFKGAILKNVSFLSTFTLSKKYYRAVKTICFDGAMMDKLTFAALKGFGIDLSAVTII